VLTDGAACGEPAVMTVLPAPESDGVPPLQFEAIDQSLLVDPFQEISAWAGTPRSVSQQLR